MTDKRALFDEVLSLMEQNGVEAEILEQMRQPEWLERVSVENLEFLLRQHRELRALKVANSGLYERWRASKGEGRRDDGRA